MEEGLCHKNKMIRKTGLVAWPLLCFFAIFNCLLTDRECVTGTITILLHLHTTYIISAQTRTVKKSMLMRGIAPSPSEALNLLDVLSYCLFELDFNNIRINQT